jgi:hypothetical protein
VPLCGYAELRDGVKESENCCTPARDDAAQNCQKNGSNLFGWFIQLIPRRAFNDSA